jgi:hypothetical protein
MLVRRRGETLAQLLTRLDQENMGTDGTFTGLCELELVYVQSVPMFPRDISRKPE